MTDDAQLKTLRSRARRHGFTMRRWGAGEYPLSRAAPAAAPAVTGRPRAARRLDCRANITPEDRELRERRRAGAREQGGERFSRWCLSSI